LAVVTVPSVSWAGEAVQPKEPEAPALSAPDNKPAAEGALGEAGERLQRIEDSLRLIEAQLKWIAIEQTWLRNRIASIEGNHRRVDTRRKEIDQLRVVLQEQISRIEDQQGVLVERIQILEKSRVAKPVNKGETAERSVVVEKPATSSEPRRGTLILDNRTGVDQEVSINSTRYVAPPGRSGMAVPYDLVEVYLVRYEAPKLMGMSNWRTSNGKDEMVVVIKK